MIMLDDNKIVRGNYHIMKWQKKEIKKIAKEKSKKEKVKVSESEIIRIALTQFIGNN